MFFALGEGAKVIYQDTYMLRHGCSTSKDTRQIVLITKRAAAFPAQHIVPGSTTAAAAAAVAGVQHPDALEHEEQQFVLRDATLRVGCLPVIILVTTAKKNQPFKAFMPAKHPF
jgi:hypothetical protein